jgi:serine/threonine protein kinase
LPDRKKEEGQKVRIKTFSIIYELIHGLPPFYSKNRAELFDKIKNHAPYYSKNWSKHLRELMEKLFEKDPYVRMKFIHEIKSHPWFFNLDWDLLLKKELPSPFLPFINGESDVSNFDKEFTECNINSFNESQSLGT